MIPFISSKVNAPDIQSSHDEHANYNPDHYAANQIARLFVLICHEFSPPPSGNMGVTGPFTEG